MARLEGFAIARPALYRVLVVLLALTGYGYLLAIGAAILAMLAILSWLVIAEGSGLFALIKLGIPLLVLGGFVARAIWVRFDPPAGRKVTAAEAPALFEDLERLRARVGAPRFDAVLITTDFNAFVAEVPRLGVFGWPRHYLALGLPLLYGLTPAQLRAVVAHELGHRAGRHGRVGGWVYRVRAAWSRLLHELEARRHRAAVLFTGFFRWYQPLFDGWSFVLARTQEYDADRLAASLTSTADVAEALVAIEVRSRFYEGTLWPGVVREAAYRRDPPAAVYTGFAPALVQGPAAPEAGRHLAAALARRTDNYDTHPALRQRLEALGVTMPALPGAPERTAADELLGPLASRLAAEFDAQWYEGAGPGWRDRHRQLAASRERLEVLAGAAAAGAETAEALKERALLTGQLRGAEASLPLVLEAAERLPGDPLLRFLKGQSLLEQQDARGVALVESAMAQDGQLTLPGLDILIGYHIGAGGHEEAARLRRAAMQRGDMEAEAARERQGVGPRDALEPHGLPPEAVREIATQLEPEAEVRTAYLARKVVRHFPDAPYFVVGVDARFGFFGWKKRERLNALLERLGTTLVTPGPAWIIVAENGNDPVIKQMKKHRSAWLLFMRTR